MSTDADAPVAFTPAALERGAWELSPSVSLRPEPFGALAYDFTTRRLSFLKSLRLVEVVQGLATSSDVAEALQAAGVDDDNRPAYLAALTRLAATGLIRPRP